MASRPLDSSSFEALYRASHPTLWCIAAGMVGDRHQAEDVLQEAAMIAFRRINQFQPGTNFVAWAGCIVRNVALNARRKQRGGAAAVPVDPMALDVAASNGFMSRPEAITANGEIHLQQTEFDDQVLAALKQLRPKVRACLLMRAILNLTYAEIAVALDMPEGTAMSHVHRARKQLRKSIEGPPKALPRKKGRRFTS